MTYDNPAARLKAILDTGLNADKNQPCFIIWCNIFNISPNDHGEMFCRIGKVMELPHEIISLLKIHYPHQVESSTLWRSQIESAFVNQQIGGKWESFINQINQHCTAHLGLIADILHNKLNSELTPDEKIADLIDKINILIAEIEKSELEKNLKIYLIRELSALLQMLREYKITGNEPVLKQVDAIIIHARRDENYLAFLKDHEIGQRVLDNLNAIAATLTIYLGMPQLSQTVSMLLPN